MSGFGVVMKRLREMPERVLVTGAGGFIGRHVVRRLLDRGYEVHALCRVEPNNSAQGLTWYEADLLDDKQLRDVVASIAAKRMIHLAWNAKPGSVYTSLENLDWAAASLRLFKVFTNAGGESAVIAGSCAEYDWSYETLDEAETPLRPLTLYGAAKLSASIALQAAARQCGVSLGWARIFFVYGPHENPARLVPAVITALLAGRHAECSSGEQQRDYMHVEDVAAALVRILESRYTGAVNVASGSCVPVRDIVLALGKHLKRPDLIKLGARDAITEAPRLAARTDILKKTLSFDASHDLDQGLLETIRWWASNHQQQYAISDRPSRGV